MNWKPRLGRQGRPLRIAYGRLFHEANAYSPLPATLEDFRRMHRIEGAALAKAASLRGSELAGYMPHAELSGFILAANAAGRVETVPLASSLAVPGGPLEAAAFEWLVADLVQRIEEAGELDGIYLALHGSMDVLGLGEAPEAVLLRRVRAALGEGPKIAVSCDLHCNLSAGLVDPVDILVAYRTNPHWDLAPTGFRAGNRLIRTLRGELNPVQVWRKLPMVLGGGVTIDFLPPMRSVFGWMRKLERAPRVISASLFMVHPFTSAADLGWAAHVCTNGDEVLAARLADELADRAWAQRKVALPPFRSIDAALDEVRDSKWRKLGPVTLIDVDDIVGAGAPGGNTRFVQALVADDRGLKALVPLHDPGAIEALEGKAVGERVHVMLRGTPGYEQPEVELDAVVGAKLDGDFGRIVRLDAGNFHVAVAERPPLPIHPKFWRELGVSPRSADLIVQKNFFHYRIFYLTTSFRHLPVESAGATSLARVRDRDYGSPRYPKADMDDWRPYDEALRAMAR